MRSAKTIVLIGAVSTLLTGNACAQSTDDRSVYGEAQPNQSAFPPNYRGSVRFNGTYQGRVITAVAPPTTRRYAWGPPVTQANSPKISEPSDTYTMTLKIDGSNVSIATNLNFAIIPTTANGTRVGSTCTFPGPKGNLIAHCGPDSFVGEYATFDGISPAVSFRMEATPVGQKNSFASRQTTADSFLNLPYHGNLVCGDDVVPMSIEFHGTTGSIRYFLPYGKKYNNRGGNLGYSFDLQLGRDGRATAIANDQDGQRYYFRSDIDLQILPRRSGVHGTIHSDICQDFFAVEDDGSAYRNITPDMIRSFTNAMSEEMKKNDAAWNWTRAHCRQGIPGVGWVCDH